MHIASWNINSVRLRISLLQEVLQKHKFDVICLQETKTRDEHFPLDAIKKLGYEHISFRGEKSYNGVAIISKIPFKKEFFFDMCEKGDKRHVAVELENGVSVHNFYIPAGGDIPVREENPKFGHKLDFVDEIRERFQKSKPSKTIIVGDFNIAPHENDVWSHKQLLDVVSHTPIEVEKLNALKNCQKWIDTHRYFANDEDKLYSWWSYRARDWAASNRGRRLDHIWASKDLKNNLKETKIFKETRGFEKPSDHAVISLKLAL
jgi:exodeoxyribonuclease-3